MSMYLAKAGWLVDVYERRSEPGPIATSCQRSWVLAMYPRGIRAVQAVADVPLLQERAYKGLVIRGKDPKKATVLERTGVLMDRTLLANALLDAARQRYSARVTFHFNATLSSVDFERRQATFELQWAPADGSSGGASDSSSTGGSTTAGYNLLVGADGTNSAVRGALAQSYPGQYDTQVLSQSSGTYKTFNGLPPLPEVEAWDPDHGLPPAARKRGNYFFALMGDVKQGSMSLCRDVDGTYGGYLAMPEEMFGQMTAPEDYARVMAAAAPQMPHQWQPLIVERLMASPLSRFPTMRSLGRFWGPGGVALLGDAAHTVTPSLGQGVNSALEDCALLARELDRSPADVQGAVRRFSDTRAPEISALQDLELLMSALLTPIQWSEPAKLPALLGRKWVMMHYFGLAIIQTAIATATGARAAPPPTAPAAAATAAAGSNGAPAAAPAAAVPNLIRCPPMFEVLQGDISYSAMLAKVRATAALGSLTTLALLWGAASGAAWAGARMLALLATMR